jgi:hypothetical protein
VFDTVYGFMNHDVFTMLDGFRVFIEALPQQATAAWHSVQTSCASATNCLQNALPVIGPMALAAGFARNAAHGVRPFRFAFALASVQALVCLGENVLNMRNLMPSEDFDFRISQAASALDIAFALTLIMRIELPKLTRNNAFVAAITALGAGTGTSLLLSPISVWLNGIHFTASQDAAMAGFTTAASCAALIGWAFRYGNIRTAIVVICSSAMIFGNFEWWSGNTELKMIMQSLEVVMALAVTIGIPMSDEPDATGENDKGTKGETKAEKEEKNDNDEEDREEPPLAA